MIEAALICTPPFSHQCMDCWQYFKAEDMEPEYKYRCKDCFDEVVRRIMEELPDVEER